MAKGIVYSTTALSTEKYELNENDLFDRIINLKIKTTPFSTTKEDGSAVVASDEFIIRSDYEIYYPNQTVNAVMNGIKANDKWAIRKCNIKPSIKVQYKRVSENTSIAIDIFITNFFVTTKDGRTLMSFNQATYDIAEIEIQMGYLGQFKKLLGLNHREVSDLTLKDLYNFNEGYGVESLRINNVEYVKVDKLVPDYTLHIHGFVGSTTTKAEATVEYTKYSTIPKNSYFTAKDSAKKSYFEQLFYQYVTKRYLNTLVFDKGKPLPKREKDGFFTDIIAEEYGTKVVCSKGVIALPQPVYYDSEGNEHKQDLGYVFLGGNRNTLNSAMQKICEYTKKDLCYLRLNNGDLIVFLKSELKQKSLPELFSDIEEYINDNQLKLEYNNKIPAVYNINIDAQATIVCPFFTWINPFQYFYFESRYALSSLTSFYASLTPTLYKFYAINISVSFATVEDVNEMTIVAVPDFDTKLGTQKED